MATKVNADHLQKLSTTHKNVGASVKAKTSKAQATTTKLKLDTSRNPAVKTVPARAQAVAHRVTVKSTTIDTRSTELAKRADYVREQAAKASTVKAPTKAVAMPATTRSASNASSSAAKLSVAAKARPKAPIVKPQPRRPTVLRPLPPPKSKAEVRPEPEVPDTKPLVDQPLIRKIERVEVLKGAGGKVRVYRSSATRTPVGNTIRTTTTPGTTNKPGPHDNPTEKTSRLSAAAVLVNEQFFVGATRTGQIKGVALTGAAGAHVNAHVALKREAGKTELVAKLNGGASIRATAKTGVTRGFVKLEGTGTASLGANAGVEAAVSGGTSGVSLRGKAEAFVGGELGGDLKLEILPGVSFGGTLAGRAGAGAGAEGEATVTANRVKFQAGAMIVVGLGGKASGSFEIDVPVASAAAQKGADNMSRSLTGQDIATNVRQSNKNLAWAARNPGQAATSIVRTVALAPVKLAESVAKSAPVQRFVKVVKTVSTGVTNGLIQAAKPMMKKAATVYKQAETAFRDTAKAARNTLATAGNKAVQLGQSAGRAISDGVTKAQSLWKGIWGS